MYGGNMYSMKRTTVFLDEETLLRLQKTAQRTGVSSASLVREAIAMYLDTPKTGAAMPSIAGKFSSGTSDTSEHVDDLLWSKPHA
jgi:metal-responsive CopG/Arc/MetJ family transcriptional regulator